MSASNNIKVVCRFRPPNALELRESGGETIVGIDDTGTTVKLRSQETMRGPDSAGFSFDRAFPMDTQQQEVFEYGVRGIVDDVMDGYNGTVFAYGQTGSGKSHTMMGPSIDDAQMKGIIPRITEQIFASIHSSPPNLEYLVKVSYMEIYMERIRDLLAPDNDNLPIHEEKSRGVYVKGLSDFYVGDAGEVYEIMRQGGNARAVSATNMNTESSRSHSIFVITIQQRNTETGTQKNGSLFLVDLAGSEKIGKTGASGQTLEEAKKINKSLSALGMVINALTDGKSSHIPYRDSKLTRILQESLGGNSRTTLIINCSPSPYNEAETISTLRFGVRAKSIKNKARVNAELSPAELKTLLKKAQRDVAHSQAYIALLEGEISTWRAGGSVDREQWASMEKALGLAPGELEKLTSSSAPPSALSRAASDVSGKVTPAIGDSRPQTPGSSTLDKDEREDFFRRENELTDQLSKAESQLSTADKRAQELAEELAVYKDHESSAVRDNKAMAGELSELKLQLERLRFESKEAAITTESIKEQNTDLTTELNEVKKALADAKSVQRSLSQESKEKKKAEKLASMMAGLDGTAATEKEAELREMLKELEDGADGDRSLHGDDLIRVRGHLADGLVLMREQQDRVKQLSTENEMLTRRRDELESRLTTVEAEYEELLDKSVQEDEAASKDVSAAVQDLKAKLEAQHAIRRDAAQSEINDLKNVIELKAQEVQAMSTTIESLRGTNDELRRAFTVATEDVDGGKSIMENAKEMERARKLMAAQLGEFDNDRKSMLKKIQERCERVVELEMALDEAQEQYRNAIRNSNSKAQQRKMDFLMRNLDQLTLVQKELVDQNLSLKREVALAEKKLEARNERIQHLETLYGDASEKLHTQNLKYQQQLQTVRDRLESVKATQAGAPGAALNFGRIAKPIRGGGDGATSTPAPIVKSVSSWFGR